MKNVYILSYEGNVVINDCPRNAKREDLIHIARRCLTKHYGRIITTMCNLKYLTEKQWYKYSEKHFGEWGEAPDNFFEVSIDYDEAKELQYI